MSSSESPDSPQLKFMKDWHQGFIDRNIDHLAKLLHEDFRCITHPRSLNQPESNKKQWYEQTAFAIGLWTHLERTTHLVIEIPGKVITHYSGKAQTSFGVELHREAITIATIVTGEDGELKIKQIEEFVDTQSHLKSIQALKTAMAKE